MADTGSSHFQETPHLGSSQRRPQDKHQEIRHHPREHQKATSKGHHHDGQADKEFKLFIGGLTGDTTNEELCNYFTSIVRVKDAFVVMDVATKKPSGFGFVTLFTQDDMDIILEMKHYIKGSHVDCKEALNKNEAKKKESEERQRKLFVGGLPKNLKDNVLFQYFDSFGPVQKAYVVKDFKSGNTRGFGFVIFEDLEGYNKALNFQSHVILDKEIHVRETHTRKEEKEKVKVTKPQPDEKQYYNHPQSTKATGKSVVDDHDKQVYVSYPPHYLSSGPANYRPGFVSYSPPHPPQPYYAPVPEAYIPMHSSSKSGVSYMPPPQRHVQLAGYPYYSYPNPEEVIYIAAPMPTPTGSNIQIAYQTPPVYRLGGAPYYQPVSSPQIAHAYYAPVQPVYYAQGGATHDMGKQMAVSQAHIKRTMKQSPPQFAASEKVISGSNSPNNHLKTKVGMPKVTFELASTTEPIRNHQASKFKPPRNKNDMMQTQSKTGPFKDVEGDQEDIEKVDLPLQL